MANTREKCNICNKEFTQERQIGITEDTYSVCVLAHSNEYGENFIFQSESICKNCINDVHERFLEMLHSLKEENKQNKKNKLVP